MNWPISFVVNWGKFTSAIEADVILNTGDALLSLVAKGFVRVWMEHLGKSDSILPSEFWKHVRKHRGLLPTMAYSAWYEHGLAMRLDSELEELSHRPNSLPGQFRLLGGAALRARIIAAEVYSPIPLVRLFSTIMDAQPGTDGAHVTTIPVDELPAFIVNQLRENRQAYTEVLQLNGRLVKDVVKVVIALRDSTLVRLSRTSPTEFDSNVNDNFAFLDVLTPLVRESQKPRLASARKALKNVEIAGEALKTSSRPESAS